MESSGAGPTTLGDDVRGERRTRLVGVARKVHLVLLLVTGPVVVGVYALQAIVRPCWQFALLAGLAGAMYATWIAAWPLVRRGDLERLSAVLFGSIYVLSTVAVFVRANTLAIAVEAYLGTITLLWLLWPRRVLPATVTCLVALLVAQGGLYAGILPTVAAPPLLDLVFGAGLSSAIVPVIAYLLHIGAEIPEYAFLTLERSFLEQERLVATIRAIQPGLVEMAADADRTSGTVAATARQQATTAEGVSGAMRRLEGGIEQTLGAAEEARRIAEAARRGAAESQRAIEAVHDQLSAFLEVSDESAGRVEQLAERSRATEDLIEAIEDVHKAIKVISVNASIEAARAGANGRGIAVLADDMRRTIATTADGIASGRSVLGAMRTDAVEAAGAARRAAAELRARIESLTEARQQTREIVGSFAHTHDAVETIVKAGQAQQEDVRSVALAMRELGTTAGALTASATLLADGTRRLSEGQTTLAEAVRAAEGLAEPARSGR